MVPLRNDAFLDVEALCENEVKGRNLVVSDGDDADAPE